MISQNGHRILKTGETRLWTIPDTSRHLRLAPGAAGFILVHFALWFHEEIESLDAGPWDDWAYDVRPVTGSTTVMSNHSSGTAVDLNASVHPYGSRNTFHVDDARRIRERLERFYGGAIRWGGDYRTTPDEMHFELALVGDPVLSVASRLRGTPRGRRVRRDNR